MLQYVADGLVLGAVIGLGAVGLTLIYAILRFANFTQGDLLSWGAYAAAALLGALAAAGLDGAGRFGPLSFGWTLVAALLGGMAAAALLAQALDWVLFARLRRRGGTITLVIASFGASLALRHLLEFVFGARPAYYSRAIQMAVEVLPGLRMTPDQLFVLALAALLMVGLHLYLTRTAAGRAMRAVAENPALARTFGIDVAAVIRRTWMLGGALAAVAGVFVGLTVQLRPTMGFDLLLPLFAAAILGGIGSPYGALLGGLIVGLAQSLAVPLVGAEYRAAVAFLVLILILFVRPTGLFGEREA